MRFCVICSQNECRVVSCIKRLRGNQSLVGIMVIASKLWCCSTGNIKVIFFSGKKVGFFPPSYKSVAIETELTGIFVFTEATWLISSYWDLFYCHHIVADAVVVKSVWRIFWTCLLQWGKKGIFPNKRLQAHYSFLLYNLIEIKCWKRHEEHR